MLLRREMHGAALAAHQAVVALHQLTQDLLHRDAARQRVRVAAIRAEGQISFLHRFGKAGGNRLLSKGQMARSLDKILEKQIVCSLLRLADTNLRAIHGEALGLADVVIQTATGRLLRWFHDELARVA
jgi:hypothetical protein